MTRRDLTGPASAYRDRKRRAIRKRLDLDALRREFGIAAPPPNETAEEAGARIYRETMRPGLTRLHNPDPAETAALNAEAARFAQRRADEMSQPEVTGVTSGSDGDGRGSGYRGRRGVLGLRRPSLWARLWRAICGRRG